MDGNKMINRMKKWQTDRNLHKHQYNPEIEAKFIIEELLESFNVKGDLGKKLSKRYAEFLKLEGADEVQPDDTELVDCYFDIIIFSIGAILKLGFEPELVIEEGLKEIESRTGKINTTTGKYEKDTSEEAKAKLYKADYDTCRIEKQA